MADSMQRAKSQANSVGRQRLRSASVPSSNDQDEPVLLFSIHQHSRRHMLVIWWRENGTQTTRQTARQTRLDSTDWLPYWPSNVQVIFLGGGEFTRMKENHETYRNLLRRIRRGNRNGRRNVDANPSKSRLCIWTGIPCKLLRKMQLGSSFLVFAKMKANGKNEKNKRRVKQRETTKRREQNLAGEVWHNRLHRHDPDSRRCRRIFDWTGYRNHWTSSGTDRPNKKLHGQTKKANNKIKKKENGKWIMEKNK